MMLLTLEFRDIKEFLFPLSLVCRTLVKISFALFLPTFKASTARHSIYANEIKQIS